MALLEACIPFPLIVGSVQTGNLGLKHNISLRPENHTQNPASRQWALSTLGLTALFAHRNYGKLLGFNAGSLYIFICR